MDDLKIYLISAVLFTALTTAVMIPPLVLAWLAQTLIPESLLAIVPAALVGGAIGGWGLL